MILKCILLLDIICTSVCGAKRYDNFTLFRGTPVEDSHLEFLQNLSDLYDVNYWSLPGMLRVPVDFIIAPIHKESFLIAAHENGVYLKTVLEDVQSAFNMQTVKTYIRRKLDSFNWINYYRADDINTWLIDLAKVFPEEVRVEAIGKTKENRDILSATIILKGCLHRSKVIIEGGIHAREWISPAFVTYMIHQIAHSATSLDLNLQMIARAYEWYFVPILNPDGYEFTHKEDRLWRKNRNGFGIDLNRNFGSQFGTVGVSFDQLSEVYCGERAFSELETSTLSKFVESKKDKLEYYLSIHSYGQYIIVPYTYSTIHLDNYAEVFEMGVNASKVIRSFHGKRYAVGTAYETVGYMASGASACWVKRTYHVPYAMTLELRDEGEYGFALPPDQILPTCEETLGGVLYILKPHTTDFKPLRTGSESDGIYSYVTDNQGKTFLDKNLIVIYTLFLLKCDLINTYVLLISILDTWHP